MDIFREKLAKAIWIDERNEPNRYVKFQSEFFLEKKQTVKFYISSDTKYELYINGSLVGFGQYDDFPKEKVYDEYEVFEYVKEGINLVSVLAYSQGEVSFQHIPGIPMVIFAATSEDGCVLKSDENIKCAEAQEFYSGERERITPQRSYNFGFDLRYDDGWKNEKKDFSKKAIVCDDSDVTYLPRPIKNLRLGDVIVGKIITQGEFSVSDEETVSKQMQYSALSYRDKDNVLKEADNIIHILKDNVYWISDLGEQTTGYITLDIEAEEGAVLDIACGEHLADLRVRSWIEDRNFGFRCVCRKGRQKISFYVKRISGRYLQFFAHTGIKKIYSAGLHRVEYPLDFEGYLQINDYLLDKIYDVSKNTLKMCMYEHYEDCPQREQALYAMDSRNQMLAGYYAFGETKMPRESLKLLAKGRRSDGLLEICAPTHFERTIPSFSLSWIIALKEYVLFSGDVSFATEMLDVAKGILDFFCKLKKDGFVIRPTKKECWNFYEWSDGMDNWETEDIFVIDAPLSCFYMLALKDFMDICDWTLKSDLKNWAKKEYDEIADAFHNSFYDEEKGAYISYVGEDVKPHFSKLTQALALLSGCVPDECAGEIRKSLLSEDLTEVTLGYMSFKYDALMQEPDVYAKYVLDDIATRWGYMLYNGATTFWETIKGEADFGGAGSLCHGWSATPIYIFWRYIMGIYPETVGFNEISDMRLVKRNFSATGKLKTTSGVYFVELKEGKLLLGLE